MRGIFSERCRITEGNLLIRTKRDGKSLGMKGHVYRVFVKE